MSVRQPGAPRGSTSTGAISADLVKVTRVSAMVTTPESWQERPAFVLKLAGERDGERVETTIELRPDAAASIVAQLMVMSERAGIGAEFEDWTMIAVDEIKASGL